MESTQPHPSFLELLSRISRELNVAGNNLSDLLDKASRAVERELDVDAVAIWIGEEQSKFMKIESSSGLSERYVRYVNKNDRMPVNEDYIGDVMRGRTPLVVPNITEHVNAHPSRWMEMLRDEGLVTMISLPILLHEQAIGVMDVHYRSPHEFSGDEMLFFKVLTDQIAAVVTNNLQFDQLSKSAKILRAQIENMVQVQQLTRLLNLYLYDSIDRSLQQIGQYFNEKFGTHAIAIFMLTDDNETFKLISSHGLSLRTIRYFSVKPPRIDEDSLLSLALKNRSPQVSNRVFTDDRISREWSIALSIEHQVSMGAFPLVVGGRVIGVLAAFYDKMHEFPDEELSILSMFSQFFAVALENSGTFHKLSAERERVQSMVNGIEDGLLVYDLDGRIVNANPRAYEMFSIPKDEMLIGRYPSEFEDSPLTVLHPLGRISRLTIGEDAPEEIEFSELNHLTVHVREVKLTDDKQKNIGSMRIIHDVTSEKAAEILKTNFVATASHQLRTPLTGVKWGLLSLLENEHIEPSDKEMLHRIVDTNESIILLVNDLLNASRLEEGKFEYHFSVGPVAPIIDELLHDLDVNIEKQGLKVSALYKNAEYPPVMRDPNKLSIALRNLLDNAIKYTPKDGTITIAMRQEGPLLWIDFTDTGIGIPEHDRDFIFNKFYRAKNAMRVRTEGSGLGLFIAKNIVNGHNGVLRFTTGETGTTFSVALPLDPASMPKQEEGNKNDSTTVPA